MKTLKDMETLLAAHGLSGYFEKMKGAVKSSVHIELEPAGDENIAIGASKMGGLPDLPKSVDWFRQELTDTHLSFICQINFAEVKPYDIEGKLPASGILYFFYDCSMDGMPWGFDPKDADGKVVYYYDGDLSWSVRRHRRILRRTAVCSVLPSCASRLPSICPIWRVLPVNRWL